jgi:hypothetical protein
VFFVAQAAVYRAMGGSFWEALWLCHVSNLVLAAGLALRSPRVVGVAMLWLVFGTGAWILNLAGGATMVITSLLTHVGGLVVAISGIRRLGFPAGTWIRAVLLFAACQLLSRWLTPAEFNLNLAHRVWEGWERAFPSYGWYLLMIYAAASSVFIVVEMLARRLVDRDNPVREGER